MTNIRNTQIDALDFDLWFERRFGKRPEGSVYILQLELEQTQRKAATLQTRLDQIKTWEAQRHAALLTLQNSATIGSNIQTTPIDG